MNNQNYTVTIEVAKYPEELFNHINDVSKWWSKTAGKTSSEFEGQNTEVNDEFIIRSADRH